MKNIVIIGAGPAGLTAAYELLKKASDVNVTVLEETDSVGGISKTVCHNGSRMDMGGHRFFSKDPAVNRWWAELMPMQSAPSKDDLILNRDVKLDPNGSDPEKTDRVMLMRRRVSRIFFKDTFFDYPVSLKWSTITGMGFFTTMQVGFSYLAACIHKLPEDNLENFYINRFGKKLYSMFFEYYTENLWGRHPREIDASWGAQRVKGLSVTAVLRDIFGKIFNAENRKVETSLIEEFKYPKFGPGQLWETVADEITSMGGTILKGSKVTELHREGKTITSVTCGGRELPCDFVISSMPLKDLVCGMNGVPAEITDIAENLPYRDYMTLGVLVPKLKLRNETDMKTLNGLIPDCWIYIQDRRVKLGRVQIYNNWSPYMVKDPENTVWVGLEYFVRENDEMWNMDEKAFSDFAVSEMITVGLIDDASTVIDTHMEKIKKAYPAYFDSYDRIGTLRDYLDGIENLCCVGRNGQHRYNNMDHSMVTAFEAVKAIISGSTDRAAIWNVNTEQEYHEKAD